MRCFTILIVCAWILWELLPGPTRSWSDAYWGVHSAYETKAACEKRLKEDSIKWGLKCLPDTVKPPRSQP